MARPRWTLTLILVCSLPVLATVVTAFRILDVPGKSTSQKSSKTDFRKTSISDTCDDCRIDGDINFGQKLHSLKIQSVPQKRSFAETRDITETDKEKHQVNVKKTLSKNVKKSITKPEDEEGDEKQFIFKEDNVIKQDKSAQSFGSNIAITDVKGKPIKTEVTIDVNSSDEDDDDEDDNRSGAEWSTKTSSVFINTNKYSDKTSRLVTIKKKEDDYDDDDDEDDDDDDDDDEFDIKGKFVHDKKQSEKFIGKESRFKVVGKLDKSPKINAYYDDSNDDDDDDSDEDTLENRKDTITVPTSTKIKDIPSKKLKTVAENTSELTSKEKESSKKEVHQMNIEKKIVEKKKEVPIKDLSKQGSPKVQVKENRSENIRLEDTNVKTEKSQTDKKDRDLSKKDDTKVKPSETKQKEKQKPKDGKDKIESIKPKSVINIEKHEKKKEEAKKVLHSDSLDKETKLQMPEKDKNKAIKQENSLKHVSEAFHRRNMLISKFEDFYSFFPTFSPNFSLIHNPECRRHGQILLRQLRGTKLWALNMLDATAKIPSGILQGNGIQLGNFDQCVSSRARVQLDTGSIVKVQGKYCLAHLDVKAERPELDVPVHLAQAKSLIKSRIDDPGHFVPRFSTLSWGVCLPAACGPQDAEVVIKDALKHYQHTIGLVIRVKVNENECRIGNAYGWDSWLELPTMLTLAFYGIVLLLVTIATLQDFLNRRKSEDSDQNEKTESGQDDSRSSGKNEVPGERNTRSNGGILTVFSLYRTLKKLVAPVSSDDIGCIHGLRALSTLALLAAHKFIPVAVTPYSNRLKITETVSTPWWSVFRAGWMYTDCFLLLSGTLSARRLSEENDSAARRFFNRYLRLTPAHLAIILFYAYIWDKISEGPLWGSLVTRNAELCQESWWWNLFYVHNYFNFEDMCAPQTHQLALDMQLSILAGVLVWLANSKPTMSKMLIIVMQAGAAYSRYSVVSEHRLTFLIYHGVSVSQLYRTARLSYTSTLHRSTPYLMGVVLGLSLNKSSNINTVTSIFCWLIASFLWGAVWWIGMDSGAVTYRYGVAFAARYAALAPLAVASSLALFIYAVHNGRLEFVSRVLSSRPLMLISRLSYTLYLCQFIVFLTNAATVRTPSEFTVMSLFDVQEISAIFLASVILTLTLVLPMQSINNYIFKPESVSTKDSEMEKIIKESLTPPEIEEEKKMMESSVARSRSILAHREVLEEIPEAEVEYEFQRENRGEGLEGILEEEEDEELVEEEYGHRLEDEDMEILEGEDPGGDEDYWAERHANFGSRRHYVSNDDQELDDWEWTNDNGRNGAQYWHSR